ncbi:MAG: hypothetical protein AAGD10_11635 [Myxococcota bacterium]
MPWWDRVKSGLDEARSQVDKASKVAQERWVETQGQLERASKAAQKRWSATQATAKTSAEQWGRLFALARTESEGRVIARHLADALEGAKSQLDREAPALAVGLFRQAGVGLASVDGMKISYVRRDGPVRAQLRASELFGTSAHLSVGAGAAGFVASVYGDRAALLEPLPWRGGDAGFWVASVGLFRSRGGRSKATGWMVGLGLGVGVGVPILSDLGGFDFEERILNAWNLGPSEAEPLEELLDGAPDARMRRGLAKRI